MEPTRERVVSEGSIRIHPTGHDLGHRVRLDQVHPLEGGHDGALGDAERRDGGREPHVTTSLGRDTIGDPSKPAEGALAARRRKLLTLGIGPTGGAGRAARAFARMPLGHLDPGVMETVGELTPDRHFHPKQVVAGHREVLDLLERSIQIRLRQGRAQPRPARLAQQVLELTTGDPVGIDPLHGQAGQARGLCLGDGAAVRLTQEFRLEREVHGP